MTLAEHSLAMLGHETNFIFHAAMHRRTAYEIYLSVPKKKGTIPVSLERFMPLPIDAKRKVSVSAEHIKNATALMLKRLENEKRAKS